GAIRSTQRADGLTGAKPDWMVAYLMDDSEAYAGLRAAARLAHAFGDPALEQTADGAGDAIANGIAALWDPATSSFDWAVHPDGTRVPADWSQLYPDAVSEAWAVRYGVAAAPAATAVAARFEAEHPAAADPAAPDLVDGHVDAGGYWPGAALAVARVDAT